MVVTITSDDWLTSDIINELNERLSYFPEVKHFLSVERPDIMLAIEKSDRKALKVFINQLRESNPFVRIDCLSQFVVCLKHFYSECTPKPNQILRAHQNSSQTNLPFIDCRINGHQMIGLIDTGAQYSIISKVLAEKCHLVHLIDQRYKTVANGVGQQLVIGKIHSTYLEISSIQMDISFMVIETFHSNYILIGQDFLVGHKCVIYCSDGLLFFKKFQLLVKTKPLSDFE